MAVGLVVSGLVLPGCVASSKYYTQQDELARTQEDLDSTSAQLKDAEDILVTSENEKSTLQAKAAQAEKLAAENAKLQAIVDDLKKKGAIVTPDGTTLIAENGMYGWRAEGDVVFSPGSDKLTKDGERILKDLAGQLKKNQQPVQVWGHTDSDPINKTKEKWTRGNIELGANRAMSVKEYLVSQGVEESRISITSYGQYQPIANGSSAGDKAKNRRVEIMTRLPDKM
jgi:chemotaxis protein MotB